MRIYRISWIMYIVGSLLVFGSWVGFVPIGLAWIGWLMALGGWAVGTFIERPAIMRRSQPIPIRTVSVADEIAKLNLLRQEGILSDTEFEREKAELLARN